MSGKSKHDASELIYEAFNEYYEYFDFDKHAIIDLIIEQFSITGSEIENTSILSDTNNSALAGLSVLPVVELSPSRLKGTFHLVSYLETAKNPTY